MLVSALPASSRRLLFPAFVAALLLTTANAQTPPGEDPKPAAVTPPPGSVVENSVVKIFTSTRYPDSVKPWTKQAAAEYTGSGVVIDGKRILTNAHVIQYASQIQVQANQAGDKLAATIEAFAPGIDLAVLKLEDESFFATHPPLARTDAIPDIKDAVFAYGFPTGGSNLSITKGIVSRIEFAHYNASVSGLRIQVDAAINPGNSGGPVVVGDKMIGLAFSHLGGAQNIGYIIPCEEIALFLEDIADGHYDGKPMLLDETQTLENPALRKFLKVEKSVEGMVVHQPVNPNPAHPLKEWDVITKVGDTPVDNQGMVKIGPNLRVSFKYLVQKVARNGVLPLTIVRAGKELKVDVAVPTRDTRLLPDPNGEYPSYFICGPLSFADADTFFLRSLSQNKQSAGMAAALGFNGNPLISRVGDRAAFEGERLVIVTSPFFPHKLTKGYSGAFLHVLNSVNGRPVRNLAHLVELLRDLTDEFVVFEWNQRGGETMVFPRQELLASTEEILTDNGVRSQGSADMLSIWNAKPKR